MARDVRVPLTEAQKAKIKGVPGKSDGEKKEVGSSPEQETTIAQMDMSADISAQDMSADISAQDMSADISAQDMSADISAQDLSAEDLSAADPDAQ